MTGFAIATPIEFAPGVTYFPAAFDRTGQNELLFLINEIIAEAALYTPTMPRSGKPLSVLMTNAGELGWVSDKSGYRYQSVHPVSGKPWPPIPQRLIDLWAAVGAPQEPQACLVNRYLGKARMGLHQDRDEETFDAPVVSVSLGDSAVFRMGGTTRKDPTRSLKLHSGDVIMFGGPARLAYHGVDRVIEGSSTLVDGGGRMNLTLRRVTLLA